MTRLEAALLFVAVWEAAVIAVLAWRIRRLDADLAERRARDIDWGFNYIRNRYGLGSGAPSPPWLAASWPVSEVLDVPPGPPLAEGDVVVIQRPGDGTHRRYRVLEVGYGRAFVAPLADLSRDL